MEFKYLVYGKPIIRLSGVTSDISSELLYVGNQDKGLSAAILLSGMSLKDKDNPNGDIEITVSGLRPGEKLYEELLIDGEALKTDHPLIFKSNEKNIVPSKFFEKLKVLEKYFEEQSEDEALALLSELVPEWINMRSKFP